MKQPRPNEDNYTKVAEHAHNLTEITALAMLEYLLVNERHCHRYEFNNRYRKAFVKKGMVFPGVYPKKNLVEIVELRKHPWSVGVQLHPEFQSKPDRAHPLFGEFIRASMATVRVRRY